MLLDKKIKINATIFKRQTILAYHDFIILITIFSHIYDICLILTKGVLIYDIWFMIYEVRCNHKPTQGRPELKLFHKLFWLIFSTLLTQV